MSVIRVISAKYRDQIIENKIFSTVRPIDGSGVKDGVGNNGGVIKIQVRNDGQIAGAGRQVYIKVENGNFEVMRTGRAPRRTREEINMDVMCLTTVDAVSNGIEMEVKASKKTIAVPETDEQAMDRIASRFAILDEMAQACINGDVRAMIVSGPPGVGKSYGVETQMEKASMFDMIAGNKVRFEVVKGAVTPIGLYAQLYKFSDPKNVLIFDDCDSILQDDLSLNILKAALDSGKRRRIFWNSDSYMLRREGIPESFEFRGSVIFITNISFENVRSKKLQDHLEALQSRAHYLDLTINDERDKMLRVRQVHRDALEDDLEGLFKGYEFENDEAEQVLTFMWDNRANLREISLRMALKVADLVKISPSNWKVLAKATVCK